LVCVVSQLGAEGPGGYDQLAQQITSGGGQALSRGKQFLSGLASSVGYCPSGYNYSFQVWNDLPTPLYAAAQTRRAIQGAQISTTIEKSDTICPFANSLSTFYQLDTCHLNVWLDADSTGLESYNVIIGRLPKVIKGLSQIFTVSEELSKYAIYKHTIDVVKDDKNSYYYRAYLYKGKAEGEFLGPNVTSGPWASSPDFDGVFYNSSDEICKLKFLKDTKEYTVTLEPHSFSLLSSTTGNSNSIRPPSPSSQETSDGCSVQPLRTFDFIFGQKTVQIPLAQEGLGKVYKDSQTQETTIVPATYTYEIYTNKNGILDVGLQGLSIGNFDQVGVDFQAAKATIALGKNYDYPIIHNVRDINPARCFIWYQSPQQYLDEVKSTDTQDTTLQPYSQGIFVWFGYQTKDQMLTVLLSPGTVTQVDLIRPQLNEKQSRLYVVSLDTGDQATAQKFIERLNKGLIGKDAVVSGIQDPLKFSQDVLAKLLPNNQGFINDTTGADASGTQGSVLLVDTFIPYGLGVGPYYYGIPSALLKVDASFAVILTSLLDPKLFTTQDLMVKEFQAKIQNWLTEFNKKRALIRSYGITQANSTTPEMAAKIQELVPDLTQYLKQKGTAGLFASAAAGEERNFNEQGLQALYRVLFGPISLQNPLVLERAGTNYYILGGKPAEWPS
jgi:hypothetical protein